MSMSMKVIYIRKMRYEEARLKLEREIHEAFLNGDSLVEIVHGLGEGKLKQMTIEFVKSHEFLKVYDTSSFIQPNPGSTKVEILCPDKFAMKRYIKK
ncbi:MAG: Smr/MutS family protein [Leptospiraceae bacterium]|nr:Smr/MutS family protein [Leptospiraceae bacterium]